MTNKIIIKGARVHNLKNINLEIPKDKLVVITGLSGSGKSSLAFDTIYAEGQRRYAESLSSYARQFMEARDKPDVDSISGLSPTIAIDQRNYTQNPRSTVGTVTEVYDYLRLLFARIGQQYCPSCDILVKAHTAGEIIEQIKRQARGGKPILVLSPLARETVVEEPDLLLPKIEKSGYDRVRMNGEVFKINDYARYNFISNKLYNIELVIGEIVDVRRQDIAKIIKEALDLGNGLVKTVISGEETIYSTNGLCAKCGRVTPVLDPRYFSFNSPFGACSRCTGLGMTLEVDPNLVIPNNRLTLSEGAIQPLIRLSGKHGGQREILQAVSERYKFSLDTPVRDLPAEILNLILYGTGDELHEVGGRKEKFAGIVPYLSRKHLETASEYIRKEIEQYMREDTCSVCHGRRLNSDSLAVRVAGKNISEIANLSIEDNRRFFIKDICGRLSAKEQIMAGPIIKEIIERLENMERVGLGYLSIDRPMNTLSGGEATRVRLATQLSTGLIGVIYVLDEPSVGLHQKDIQELIKSLKSLRDLGNTVIVVEHDKAMITAADYVVDIGPGAGLHGGWVAAKGTVGEVKKAKDSLTGVYLSEKLVINNEKLFRKDDILRANSKSIKIIGATANNLKNVNVSIPLQKLVCVTGVSGSGKSTLVLDILGKALARHFYKAKDEPGKHSSIDGLRNIDKVITIDQSPIGRTPRSNPATYTNIFTLIRDLFANQPESKMYGYNAGKFSFNVSGGGRCEACAGEGYARIPMQFLADVYVECAECCGTRYSQNALEVHYKGKNIAEVLNMTTDEAYLFFSDTMSIASKLNVLREVGLGYIRLGQPATTLSGGEAQRIKLAAELSRNATGRTLYILDEPTTGLHFEDIKKLMLVLSKLVDKGNTVLIIEHNLDVISRADWVIDLGPGSGEYGGEIVAEGAPADIAKVRNSWTGKFLKKIL